MKKKVFLQNSIILYIILTFFLAIIGAIIYAITMLLVNGIDNENPIKWIYLIASIFALIFISYMFIKMARNRIVLKSTEIYVPANWGSKKSKIQYETKIPYEDIQNIFIISSSKNSLNQKAEWIFTPMPYIIFDCKNDKQKAINVYYYSKNQVVKIIDEIITRAKNLGNNNLRKSGTEILSSFLDLQKK